MFILPHNGLIRTRSMDPILYNYVSYNGATNNLSTYTIDNTYLSVYTNPEERDLILCMGTRVSSSGFQGWSNTSVAGVPCTRIAGTYYEEPDGDITLIEILVTDQKLTDATGNIVVQLPDTYGRCAVEVYEVFNLSSRIAVDKFEATSNVNPLNVNLMTRPNGMAVFWGWNGNDNSNGTNVSGGVSKDNQDKIEKQLHSVGSGSTDGSDIPIYAEFTGFSLNPYWVAATLR